MVRMLASNAVDHGVKPCSGYIKDYEIGICCLSTKHAALRSKSKTGWLRIKIMCLSGGICLPADCCFSKQADGVIHICTCWHV